MSSKALQNDPKIGIWTFRGRTFEILDGFLRSLIFDEFPIGKSMLKISDLGSEGRIRSGSSEVRRVGRGRREALESADPGEISDTPQAPLQADGGGGFKGLRPTRRPPKSKNNKKIKCRKSLK